MDIFTKGLALVTGTLSVSRAVHLVLDDDWPVIKALREWWIDHTSTEWHDVIECPWCAAPYIAAPAVLWGGALVAFPTNKVNNWAWWLVNGWAALSFAAAYINLRDVPPKSR